MTGRPPIPTASILIQSIFDIRMALLTNGKADSDGLEPHDDLLAGFPYLGPPSP